MPWLKIFSKSFEKVLDFYNREEYNHLVRYRGPPHRLKGEHYHDTEEAV